MNWTTKTMTRIRSTNANLKGEPTHADHTMHQKSWKVLQYSTNKIKQTSIICYQHSKKIENRSKQDTLQETFLGPLPIHNSAQATHSLSALGNLPCSARRIACRVYGRYSRIAHDRVYPSKMEQFRIDKDHFSSVFKLAFEDLASTRSVMVVISICRRWEVKAKQKNKKYRIQSCSITRSVFRCCHKYFRACQTMSNSNHFDLPSECPLEQFHH